MVTGYTDEQIRWIIDKRNNSKMTWKEIAEAYNAEFGANKSKNSIKKTYFRYKNIDFSEQAFLANARTTYSTRKRSSQLAKENRVIVEAMENSKSIVEQIDEVIKSQKFSKYSVPTYRPSKKKSNMTMEPLFSDLHMGKKSKGFDKEVALTRIKKFSAAIVGEIERNEKNYNVEKIVLAFLGDLIENSTFHGIESMAACEMTNSEQIALAIDYIFHELILPIAMTGRKMVVPCVTGNHDRDGKDKTYNYPGKTNHTWTIYTILDMLCKTKGLTNVEFIIPDGVYTTVKIYDDLVLYEHLDYVAGNNKNALENHIAKRSKQLKKMVTFLRGGHWHECITYDKGRIVINGSICGADSFSEVKGYSSAPCQVINFYVETDNRTNSYYHTFPVDLE
jgi:hypothetical protein